MTTWRADVASAKLKRQLVTKAVGFLRHARLAPAFNAWVEHAAQQASYREKLGQCIARMAHLKLWQAFQQWKDTVLVSDASWDQAGLHAQRRLDALLGAAFIEWQSIAAMQQSRQRKVCHFSSPSRGCNSVQDTVNTVCRHVAHNHVLAISTALSYLTWHGGRARNAPVQCRCGRQWLLCSATTCSRPLTAGGQTLRKSRPLRAGLSQAIRMWMLRLLGGAFAGWRERTALKRSARELCAGMATTLLLHRF